jgi:hypothetical protein
MTSYNVTIPVNEFREYLVETDESGPWGDKFFLYTFGKYIDDDAIEIEYKYGDYKNGLSIVKWRVAEEEAGKVYSVRYRGSSRFAMWWCSITDGVDDE